MASYVQFTVCLPRDAAEQLTGLACQQRSTIDNFVGDIIQDWLEQRRKDIRLGRKIQTKREMRASASDHHKGE